uniref:Lipoprotein n=1 Tax=Streptomyces sp. NBC_00049 TaxID=2903617 RepID=A0AAU2JH74_9ACTN
MQLRRAVPLSLVALLASAGCVSVGPAGSIPAPARGALPPLEAPDVPGAPGAAFGADGPPALPLGKLPADPDSGSGPGSGSDPAPDASPAPRRAAKAAPKPRRARPSKPSAGHPHRRPAPPPLPRMDELCAAADGNVPPSIVDLCLRQYGR